MKHRALGTSSLEVAPIGLVCCQPTGRDSVIEPLDDNESIAAIHTALDLGLNYLEVWPIGDGGRSERLAARALAGRPEKLVLAGVCGHPAAASGAETPPLDRADRIIASCENSLRRLERDHFDLLYCHWPSVVAPVSEVVSAFAKLMARGDVRAVGLSHYGCEQLTQARRMGPIHAVRAGYNLLEPEEGRDLLSSCREHRIAFFACDPLSRGRLSDRYYRKAGTAPGSAESATRNSRRTADARAFEGLSALAASSSASVAQVALRWVLGAEGVTAAVLEATRPSLVREYADAAERLLSEEEIRRVHDVVSQRMKELDR